MSYIDGFVIAVPTANKQKFIDHAYSGASDPRSDDIRSPIPGIRSPACAAERGW